MKACWTEDNYLKNINLTVQKLSITALLIYIIYYLEITWKTKLNHILSQSSMFNVFMFPNVSVFKQRYPELLSILGISFSARGRPPASCINDHTHAPWCLSRIILGPNKTSGHAQTILSLWIRIYIYSHQLLKTSMRTHLPEKVLVGRIYVILKLGGHVPCVIYAPALMSIINVY